MNFELSEEQKMIQLSAREFACQRLLPGVLERDQSMIHPTKQLREMGELGFMGMMVTEKYGGSGLDSLSYVLAVEEISKVDNSCSVAMSVNNSLVCWGLETFGTESQKEKYLFDLAQGKKIGAFCLSEPEAGSDATHQKTIAQLQPNGDYLLNGLKNWITNGKVADVYIVIAQSDPKLGHKGINAFIVESDWKGVSTGEKEDKLGIRSSDTCTVIFEDVLVPSGNRIGEEGFGFKFAMKTLAGGRIGIAAQALGIASGAYERALEYAQNRKTFGKAIIDHQGISFMLAEMATEIEAARRLVYKAAQDKEQGHSYDISSSMAKLYAAEVAMKVTVQSVQIHGGNGYVKEYHVERLMRDAKITQIYEGTSEIQKLIIARFLTKM